MELVERLAALLAATDIEELGGGHQARVFRVIRRVGDVVVAKVMDATLVDRHELDSRLAVITALSDLDGRVCRPLANDDRLVAGITGDDGRHYYVVCFEFAEGTAPDPAVPADANQMGRELARLHTSMSRLPVTPLPLVAALRTAPPGAISTPGEHQLLHGDFNASNLRKANGGLRIFDLDDCGCGPPAFDVANALYMVLFDAVVHTIPETYATFRESFVSGYIDTAPRLFDADVLDDLIDRRVASLEAWLDDLDHAPTGIRIASPEWHATLRAFADEYNRTGQRRRRTAPPLGHRRRRVL
jgi:Ser/Thr protein kinase RdoA (MazF antagonist)